MASTTQGRVACDFGCTNRQEQILDRVNYYNKLTGIRELSGLTHVSDVTNSNGTYNCDAFEFTRYFSPDLLLDKHFGDWTTICETPSIVKTRPLSGDNINNVILRECQDFCVWGGYSRGSPTRLPFVFEMQYARPDAIAGAKVEGPARSAGGSSLAPAIARREAAGALAREV